MPTQMGSTPLPEVSFSTTTGMLVTGSIIKPRIFTSSSMVASLTSPDVLADQTVWTGSQNLHLHVFSQKILARRSEIYHAIAGGTPGPLVARGVAAVNQDFVGRADELFIARDLNLALALVQNRQAAALFFFGYCVGHVHGRRIGARRVLERENSVVLGFFQ